MSSVLAFDLWGEYGHYRKIYTTTSPLTYSIPPRTAITGLIGAILGLGKNEYLGHFSKKDAKIAVQVLNPVKKITLSENLIDTKKAGKMMNQIRQRTQIRIELLKNPKYRIYLTHTDTDLQKDLTEKLKKHHSVYTPCLGLSEHIANFGYAGEYKAETLEEVTALIHTAIPEPSILDMEFESGKEYIQESMPNEMTPNRVVTEYMSVIIEQKGKPVNATVTGATKLDNGKHITFL